MPALLDAIRASGTSGRAVAWDSHCEWGSFDLVLVRSIWDYAWRVPEFSSWVDIDLVLDHSGQIAEYRSATSIPSAEMYSTVMIPARGTRFMGPGTLKQPFQPVWVLPDVVDSVGPGLEPGIADRHNIVTSSAGYPATVALDKFPSARSQ